MTFLLFLASVVVLEYLLRDGRQKSGGPPESHEITHMAGEDGLVSNETSTADLLCLGQALDRQKTGKTPDSATVHKEGVLP